MNGKTIVARRGKSDGELVRVFPDGHVEPFPPDERRRWRAPRLSGMIRSPGLVRGESLDLLQQQGRARLAGEVALREHPAQGACGGFVRGLRGARQVVAGEYREYQAAGFRFLWRQRAYAKFHRDSPMIFIASIA